MDLLNYGVIGNGKSAALISQQGSIKWLCLPDFNSQSMFAAILDKDQGGIFQIIVDDAYQITQNYISRTNILVTRFRAGNDCFEVHDFMPRYKLEYNEFHCPPDLVRYIRHVSGKPTFCLNYDPRPCYARYKIKKETRRDFIKVGTVNGSYESIYLYADLNLPDIAAGNGITITKDAFVLVSYNQKLSNVNIQNIQLEYEKTRVYWLDWVAKMPTFEKYNDPVVRSALTLKLLSFQETGALLAAVTTSIPETIGAERNWDYRFCWLRDASMIVEVMTRLNHYNLARKFMAFLIRVIPYKNEKIQIMYGINGQKILTEKTLDHLAGFENSRPVRIGNAAYRQKQNDIFGILLDVIYNYLKSYKRGMKDYYEEIWTIVRSLARHVENNWNKPDMSLWEFRTSKKHFTFSKVLSWVAMDRAARIAEFFNKDSYIQVWKKFSDKIKKNILEKGWNDQMGAFTQAYGETQLDAANLLIEQYGFLPADDPRYISTVKQTQKELSRNGLMYRYRNKDDFGKPESSFTICTFWLIKSLYKIGEKKEAIDLFENILSCSNHLGLFSEDLDFETKRLLGNFPQGYSHLALIDTALTLGNPQITKLSEKYGFC